MSKRRHYRGITSMSLGDLKSALSSSVKPTDVLVGAVAGLAGVAAAKYGMGKLDALLATKGYTVPELVGDLSPVLGAAAAGVALYAVQKGSAQGAGHLAGALAGGLAITAGGLAAKHQIPGFNGVVSVNLKGLITPQIPMNRTSLSMIAPNRRNLALVSQNPRQSMGLITASPLTTPSRRRA